MPRGALYGAAGLIAIAIVSATLGSIANVGTTRVEAPTEGVQRWLRFEDRPDGAIAVYDAETGKLATTLPPNSSFFIRGIMRSIAFARSARDIGPLPPVRLTLRPSGRLDLDDPSTGQVIDLDAFGSTNRRAFDLLMTAGTAG